MVLCAEKFVHRPEPLEDATMTRADGLLHAIAESPEDDAPRLVYADWLEERGDPRHELIRVQLELARLDEGDDRRWELLARERRLLRAHGKHWAGPLRRFVKRYYFRRGFVEGVTLRAAAFLENAGELFRLAPVRIVRLLDAVPHLPDLGASPHLAHVRSLDLRHQPITREGLQTLLNSPHLTGLNSLNLRGTHLCNSPGMRFLAGCPALANLTALDLSDHHNDATLNRREFWESFHNRSGQRDERLVIVPAAIEALSQSPHLAGLTELGLGGHQYHVLPETMEALAASPLLERLTALDLRFARVHGWRTNWEQTFFGSPRLANLRTLHLAGTWVSSVFVLGCPHLRNLTTLDLSRHSFRNYYGDDDPEEVDETGEEIASFAASEHLPNLTRLRLSGCHLNNAELRELGGAAGFPRLACLELDQNGYNPTGMRAFVAGKLLAQLRVLNLQGPSSGSWPEREDDWLGDDGVTALAQSPNAAGLIHLDLGNQRVGSPGVEALARSPHLAGLRWLGLWKNRVGAGGARALIGAGALPQLDTLDLRSNPLSDNARSALRRRFGTGVMYGTGPSGRNARQERRHGYGDGDDEAEE
jgi:uncharacterized protein (TIGR02996 family)